MKKIILLFLALIFLSGCDKKQEQLVLVVPTITPTFTPTPTPDIQKLYGPCANVKVLMYHHIKPEEDSLTVTPEYFKRQMQYLKEKKYSVITPKELINYFDNGVELPVKSALITFDDAYNDNYTYAYPILKEFGFAATIFVPTGHVGGKEYLNWDQINEMKDLVYFGNHTWSHNSSAGTLEVQEKEIGDADKDLSAHGLNLEKIFAYPYGKASADAEIVLDKYKYKLAFTTTHGSLMCTKKQLELPRIRIGNATLNKFGI